MATTTSFLALFSILLACLSSLPLTQSQTYFGAAVLRGSYLYPQALGWITFAQSAPAQPTAISITMSGLPAGVYALHVHQWGDLTSGIGPNNISTDVAGSHFNPFNASHGCAQPGTVSTKHVGDIGNLTISTDYATTTLAFNSPLIALAYNNQSIIGRSVIIHNSYDHCTQPTGGAGTPIIQGVVGIANPYLNYYAPSSLPPPTATTVNSAALPLLYYPGVLNTDPDVKYGFLATQSAVAVMYPIGNKSNPIQQAQGVVRFSLNPTQEFVIDVTVTLRNLPPSTTHGFHVHVFGDDFDSSVPPYAPAPGSYTGTDHFADAGTHFNPYGEPHAFPGNMTRHEGDLGNVTSDANGSVDIVLHSSLIDVSFWNTSIIGRAVIVHALPDTGAQPTGAAGDRILAGIIGLSNLPGSTNVNTDFTPFPVPGGNVVASSSGTVYTSTGDMTSSTGGGDGLAEEEEYIGIAVVIALLVSVLVVVALYIRYSYHAYEKACHVCDCSGCFRYYCGGKKPETERGDYAQPESGTTGYGALRD